MDDQRSSTAPPPYPYPADVQAILPREATEHTFRLKENNRDWVTLKLYSGAKSSTSLPVYFEKEEISGSLEINAERGDSIHSITAKVVGRIVTGGHTSDSLTFLDKSLSIWAKSPEIPKVSSSEGMSGNKLIGYYKWPLSISLPRDVVVPWSTGTATMQLRKYRLPETFLERHIEVSVVYRFTIVIGRGRLRSDSRIDTAFAYVPYTKPESPSLLRQLAYTERCPLPGPEADPGGWKTFVPVVARGTLLPDHPVNVECTLSLAKPLFYTRGTLIPCALKLESNDTNVLNMFAVPAAIVLQLRRRVRYFSQWSEMKRRENTARNETVGEMGTATWWYPPTRRGSNPESSCRYLEGEIKLNGGLRATSGICHFSVSYFVALCTFRVPCYRADSDVRDLLEEEVGIATMHADGPHPHAYSDAPRAAHDADDQRVKEPNWFILGYDPFRF